MKLPPASVLSGVSAAVVIAAVAAGLFVLGSPAEERARRFDERRVTDLHAIAAATDVYWTRHARLPESLEELASEPGVRIATGDPASSLPYGYRALDDAGYELCAYFERESVEFSRGSAAVAPIFEQSCQLCHGPLSISLEEADRADELTEVDEPPEVDEPIPSHLPARERWAHGSGRQCFQLEAREVSGGHSTAR